jgi:hypothetical protein
VVIFELGIKISPLEKKLGREQISMHISEWEMNSLVKALAIRNKTLYARVIKELIDEGKKEGYEMMLGSLKLKVKCPHCNGEVEI